MNQTGNPIKALVTGCSGFIGSHLASALIKKGWQVYALVRQTTDTTWLEEQKIHLVYGDYTDADSLEKAAAGMDYVFHLGALINGTKWEDYYRANTLATGNLLAACEKSNPGVKRFVFVSSIAAAGPSGKGQLKNEDAPCRPVSLYGKSKMEAEQLVHQYWGRLPMVIIRPPNVLGPRQRELESTLKLVKKRIVPLLGNGDRQTSICFVEDVVRALILAAENDAAVGQTYFVTDNRQYSWRDMLNSIARGLGVSSFVIKIPFPFLYVIGAVSELVAVITRSSPLVKRKDILSARNNYWLFDSQKIEKELGFIPTIDFERGIIDTISWYREQGIL